jgi:hypothetical protein
MASGSNLIPDASEPLQLSRSNAGEFSDYTFKFTTTTFIRIGASVSVEFPAEYGSNNLGITKCSGYVMEEFVKTEIDCTVAGRVVTLPVPQIDAGLFKIGVRGVQNPSDAGGVGRFKIKTY